MKPKVAQLGLLLGVALILSYVESLFPFAFGVPGMKLGLPNLAIVLTLYLFGWKDALIVNIARILVSGFLFGSLFGILFSLSGALISFLFMVIAKKTTLFSIKGTSVCGGVMHNVGQMFVAVFIVSTSGILYYLPVLMIAGAVTGFVNGVIAEAVLPHIARGVV